ncbi:autotransporter outer membrane beta-barrel domain-containing protein [Asticcacaulis machinosus]|uniref:Autotransporter domain-containing protein n=1 Tax=Asticcacaulis machinosus TaxID=2984211 RepID=A0ABT5HEY1_9CAUL|nr:autotransporter outer membrane beta-barrel domain-containing protein [Asticcacaulis machinosus]MDC7674810.1 autotransporter domain-containing protein [Asticcacaulis machinosus]
MRKSHLRNATAIGLILAAGISAHTASAETSITTERTTPIATSTANNGAADDVKIAAAGSIKLASGTAITLDSNHKVTTEGAINMASSADNSTGILVNGGTTGEVSVKSNITVTDNYTPADSTTDDDDFVDGEFATGTGRYGIRLVGASPFTGKIEVTSASVITIEGNQSYGIRLESPLAGNFSFDGAIAATGTDTKGISIENNVTGNVYVSGTINTLGQNATALNLTGNVSGSVILDGTISGTGYRFTSALTDAQLALLDPDDLYQNGPLVSISGNLSKGLLLNATVAADTTNTDIDGDGTLDANQTTANLTQYGGSPALLIGSATQDITLNSVVTAKATDSFGLVVKGNVNSAGLYKDVNTTAIQIGGLGRNVVLQNGLSIQGNVNSVGTKGNATGVSLLSGANVANFVNSGNIRVTTTTLNNNSAIAVDIAAGAVVPAINNSGTLSASGGGTTASAIAVRDRSNSLTTFNNTGFITAVTAPGDENNDGIADTSLNRGIAIDTRTNSAGLTLTQTDTKPDDDTVAAPFIQGDILLGSGNDALTVNGGQIIGNIDFGAGANSLLLDKKAVVLGKITGSGSVALNVAEARLGLTGGSQVNLSSLRLGAKSELYVVLDPDTATTPVLINSGTTTIDSGAKVLLSLTELIKSPVQFTVMTGSNINIANLDAATLDQNVPWLYKAALSTGTGGTNLYADFRLKTQVESGLSVNEYSALDAILTAAQTDTATSLALLAQTNQSGFDTVYSAFLPDYSGEALLTLSKGHEALNHSLSKQSFLPSNGETQYWLQEYGFHMERERGDTTGFKSTGFAFAGGAERGLMGNQAVGIYLAYTTTTPEDTFAAPNESSSTSDLSIGGYWRLYNENFKAWASAGVGRATFDSKRELISSQKVMVTEADWSGISYSGNLGASYEAAMGPVSIRPQVGIDFYALSEDDRTETGGGSSFDLTVESRDSHLASASALVVFGRANKRALIQPEIWVGYRQNVSVEIADTTARFGAGNPFTLTGGDVEGGSPVVGFRIGAANEYGYLAIEAEAEKYDSYENYSVSLRTGFKF